jgi:hypothetical protein
MLNKDNIQHEVERTLLSLEGMKRAEANPFLFTRIKAKMQNRNGWERVTSFISQPAVAIAALIIVIAVNGWAILGSGNENLTRENASVVVTDIADEYNLAANAIYDYENTPNE